MDTCQPGGTVDAVDSKSTDGDIIRVQVPWLVPIRHKEVYTSFYFILFFKYCFYFFLF